MAENNRYKKFSYKEACDYVERYQKHMPWAVDQIFNSRVGEVHDKNPFLRMIRAAQIMHMLNKMRQRTRSEVRHGYCNVSNSCIVIEHSPQGTTNNNTQPQPQLEACVNTANAQIQSQPVPESQAQPNTQTQAENPQTTPPAKPKNPFTVIGGRVVRN